jgi:RNA polymerase sigma-70 factor, ECF subfamily
MPFEELSDEDLMGRFRKTLDEDIFRVLASRHYEPALRIAEQRCGDAAAAQDAVQEALIRVVRHRRRYDPSKPFAPWFHTILRNICSDLYRKAVRQQQARDAYEASLEILSPDDASIAHARALTGDLPADQAQLLDLRYQQGMSLREISNRLGCSIEAAKKRLQRVVRSLRP